MFTGIIEDIGRVVSLVVNGEDMQIGIAVDQLDMSDVKLGDSIATNGVCLTVVSLRPQDKTYVADVSAETLKRSTFKNIKLGDPVNLEKAMLPTTRFGGHIVSGHIDGCGQITQVESLGKATEYWIEIDPQLSHYLAIKGSITVHGISLTVNDIQADSFKITIVPHTHTQTSIAAFDVGRNVNIEIDLFARYIERLLLKGQDQEQNQSRIDMNFLQQHGFA